MRRVANTAKEDKKTPLAIFILKGQGVKKEIVILYVL